MIYKANVEFNEKIIERKYWQLYNTAFLEKNKYFHAQ